MRGAGTMKGKYRARKARGAYNAARPTRGSYDLMKGRDARWARYGALAASAVLSIGLIAFVALVYVELLIIAVAVVAVSGAGAVYLSALSRDVDFYGDLRD